MTYFSTKLHMPSNSDILVTAIHGKDDPKYLHIFPIFGFQGILCVANVVSYSQLLVFGTDTFCRKFQCGYGWPLLVSISCQVLWKSANFLKNFNGRGHRDMYIQHGGLMNLLLRKINRPAFETSRPRYHLQKLECRLNFALCDICLWLNEEVWKGRPDL
jgi:hypothetical protein